MSGAHTNGKPTHLDLFSGIGGFALAAQWAGFRTVAFCEIDPYCCQVLAKNFGAVADADNGRLPQRVSVLSDRGESARSYADRCHPQIHRDIFDFDGTRYRGVSLLTGGFPCQPFSVAGKRRGAADDRAIWPEMFRVIAEARPAWLLAENVPGIIPMELDNVLSQLEGIGYACRAFVIPACAVDARHRRDRLWIVGRDVADDAQRSWSSWQSALARSGGEIRRPQKSNRRSGGDVPDTNTAGLGERRRPEPIQPKLSAAECAGQTVANADGQSPRRPAIARSECCLWEPEPDVGRVAHGIPKRVDRLRGLGNAIVPQVAFQILREIRALL